MPVSRDLSFHVMPKTKRTRSQKDINHDEIQALLAKLKEIVPNMPRDRKLSKLEIIQYVIDYIVDLQIALESGPIVRRATNARNSNSAPRQPLDVISANSVANTYAAPEGNKAVLYNPDVIPDVSC